MNPTDIKQNADIGRNLRSARQKIAVADQLLGQTLSLSKEPKVLAVAFDNIHGATDSALKALLSYRQVDYSNLESNSDFKLEEFSRLSRELMMNPQTVDFVRELYSMMEKRQKSSVEFARRGKYVICSQDYELEVLNERLLSDYLKRCKQLVFELFLIIKHEDE